MKLSVVVSAYNVSDCIEACLESILNQRYRKLEVIVINDGSLDNTVEIVQRFQEDKRLILINQRNGGLSNTRNVGIQLATGDLITFLDGEEILAPDTYSDNIPYFLSNPELKMVQFPVFREKEIDAETLKNTDEQLFTGEEPIFKAWWKNELFSYSVCNKLFRNNLFRKMRFPVGRAFEDLFILPQLSKVIDCALISPKGGTFHFSRKVATQELVLSYPKFRDLLDARLAIYRHSLKFETLKQERIAFLFDIYYWQLHSLHLYSPDERENSFYDLKKCPFLVTDFLNYRTSLRIWAFSLTFSCIGFKMFYFLYQKWNILNKNDGKYCK